MLFFQISTQCHSLMQFVISNSVLILCDFLFTHQLMTKLTAHGLFWNALQVEFVQHSCNNSVWIFENFKEHIKTTII